MNETHRKESPRALVIGGSLGGLFAANLLRRAGWEVQVFERSRHDLDSRGGGIVLQPDVVAAFRASGIEVAGMDLGVASRHRTVLRPDGSIESRQFAPQTQTSWSLIYSTLKQAFGEGRYHRGKTLVAVEQDDLRKKVTAHFEDGTEATGDLLIGADGNGSTVRRLLWPGETPSYAGYLAWRGLLPEDAMPEEARDALHGDFGFANGAGSHILGYLVPGEGNDTRACRRLYNWVWYRTADEAQLRAIMTDKDGRDRGFSLPEGSLAPARREALYQEASLLLPPPFRAVVQATEAPFAQAIRDFAVEEMVNGRVVLLGDAAFVPRPHTAASTSKAARNAIDLAAMLRAMPDDIDGALARWQPEQLDLGQALYRQGRRIGDALLFHQPPLTRVG